MKKQLYFLPGILFALMLISSCNQVEESGSLKFDLDLSEESALKAADDDAQVVEALVSVQNVNGELIYDKEPLELIRFGDQFVTRSLKLPVGEFMLTEFMLINSFGEVVWATPKEGSRLAHLVRTPLPQFFGIQPDETTSLDIQVIRVNDHPPEDFGYAQFNIEFVNRFCLQVYFNCRCMETGTDTTPVLDASGRPILQPRFMIWSGDRLLVDEPLLPGLNHYPVPRLNNYYTLMAFGHYGEQIFEQEFGADELMEFRCDPDFPPLMIYNEPNSEVIITPEGLYEPTITQGIFGSIVLPVDDHMDENGTDVWPVVRDIYFFPFNVLDSIYTFAPMGCYIPFHMIPMEPVAIVRTNSDGIFQVPMEVGEYLYLVKLEEGYYLDAFISSHRPGHVIVYPGEVTKIEIHVIDCSMWQ